MAKDNLIPAGSPPGHAPVTRPEVPPPGRQVGRGSPTAPDPAAAPAADPAPPKDLPRPGSAPAKVALPLADADPAPDTVLRRRPPRSARSPLGLRPPPWYQGVLTIDGRPLGVPRSVHASAAGATLTQESVSALAGKSFKELAAIARTPADIAMVITPDWLFEYEEERTNGGTGPGSTRSTNEMLARPKGVCRDFHRVAQDLLQANGIKAELIGYWAGGTRHVVVAYEDPKTRQWGIMEYDTLIPPEAVKGDNPVEALLLARPDALVVHQFSGGDPDKRGVIDAVLYTPTMRMYEAFMRGPGPGDKAQLSVDDKGMAFDVPLDKAGKWQGKARIVVDSRTPHMQGSVMVGAWRNFTEGDGSGFRVGGGAMAIPKGSQREVGTNKPVDNAHGLAFVSVEEFHPELFKWGGKTVAAGVSSHTEFHGAVVGSEQEGLGETGYIGGVISNLKSNPEAWVEGRHDLDGDPQAELKWRATVGARLDAVAAITHWVSGGKEIPVNAYATLELALEPESWLEVGVKGYVPLANFTNDDLDEPAVGAHVRTPYLEASVTTSAHATRVRADVRAPIGGGAEVGGWVQHTIDGRTQEEHTEGGFQTRVSL